MATAATPLGTYLRDRRTRLDPAALGYGGRRRTPGLRREEVATRANISPTWYTWLEQGRGGAPSPDVLNRLATGLMLTEPEREHLFMLALGRPPEVRYHVADAVSPRLQRVLDAFGDSPAIVRNAIWDIVAWNRAATILLTDYSALPPSGRNVLRLMFSDPKVKAAQEDWWAVARFVVGTFRADAVRAGATQEATRLAEELLRESPEFATIWQENEVEKHGGGGVKRLHHPQLGPIALEYSSFAVDGRPELSMIVYNPANDAERERIRAHIAAA